MVKGGSHRLAEQKNPEVDLHKFSPLIFAKSANAAAEGKSFGKGAEQLIPTGKSTDFDLKLTLCTKKDELKKWIIGFTNVKPLNFQEKAGHGAW